MTGFDPTPIKIPQKISRDRELSSFFSQLTRSLYQLWFNLGGQDGGVLPDARISESSVTQHEGAIDHGSIAGLTDDDHTQYHNDTRADTWLATKDTGDLAEGSNLYFTDERAQDAIGGMVDSTLTYTDATPNLGVNLGNSNVWTAAQSVPDDAYAVGWNGSVEVPTKNAIYDKIEGLNVSSGTFTPTLTNVANLDGSTAYACQYLRVGNTVTVSGKVDVNPTTTSTTTQLGISIPVASTFASAQNCGGAAYAQAIVNEGAAILADTSNNRAQLEYICSDTTNQSFFFSFTYQVI